MKPHIALSLVLPLALLPTGCRSAQTSAPAAPGSSAHPAAASSAAPLPPGKPAPAAVPTSTYTDPSTGVSFRYPAVWQTSPLPSGYLPPALADDTSVHIRQTVVFSPAGNLYEKTNLSDLGFTFAVASPSDAAACRTLVSGNTERASPVRTVTSNGVSYTEIDGGDAAMSHRLNFTLDSTFRAGTCLLFERDFATLAPGVQEGTTTLTSAENRALQKHLDAVFASVTLP